MLAGHLGRSIIVFICLCVVLEGNLEAGLKELQALLGQLPKANFNVLKYMR